MVGKFVPTVQSNDNNIQRTHVRFTNGSNKIL